MRTRLLLIGLVAVWPGCSGDSAQTHDAFVTHDQSSIADHARAADRETAADLRRDAQTKTTDLGGGSEKPSGAWPPATPYHSNQKVCTLPACDPNGAATVDLSGKWTQTVTTNAQTCNVLVQQMKPQLQIGHIETLTSQTIYRQGECVYRDKVGGSVIGVIKGNLMITCEVQPDVSGVTPIVESQVTFNGTAGTGPAWTYLFGIPAIVPPTECQANCTVEFKRE